MSTAEPPGYGPGTRNGHEKRRLIKVANEADQRGELLWLIACGAANRATAFDMRSPLVQMRRLLDRKGIDHRAPDGFGTSTP